MDIRIDIIDNGWVLETEDERRVFFANWDNMVRAVLKYLDQNHPGPVDYRSEQTDLFEPNQD